MRGSGPAWNCHKEHRRVAWQSTLPREPSSAAWALERCKHVTGCAGTQGGLLAARLHGVSVRGLLSIPALSRGSVSPLHVQAEFCMCFFLRIWLSSDSQKVAINPQTQRMTPSALRRGLGEGVLGKMSVSRKACKEVLICGWWAKLDQQYLSSQVPGGLGVQKEVVARAGQPISTPGPWRTLLTWTPTDLTLYLSLCLPQLEMAFPEPPDYQCP
jgi:hypothetical protein